MNLLLIEFDRKATKKKAHQLLSNYRTLIRIAAESDMSEMASNYLFEVEEEKENLDFLVTKTDDMNRSLLAKYEIIKIREGINRLDEHSRQIIYDKYIDIDRPTNISIFMKYHISESTFYRDLEKATICFAEAYNNGELIVEK
ncbi:ArpU family phage packaging/lysis transcriptional regulator [Enterococcus sp. LJL99]